jgi:hypothetical protein
MAEEGEMEDMAAALNAAFDEVESKEVEGGEEQEPQAAEEVELQEVEPDKEPSAEQEAPAEVDPGTPDVVEQAEPEVSIDSPPDGLPPAARESWSDTPESVRKYIAERQGHYEAGIAKFRDGAQRAEQMDKALAPYQQFFAINGNNPARAIDGVLSTASVLQMGAPQQKAQMVAQMIQQFGVDIPTLDGILSGQAPENVPHGTNDVQQQVQAALQPYIEPIQQWRQSQQTQQQQQANQVNNEIQQFAADPKNEFYKDVRNDMADLIESYGRRGEHLALSDAYERACRMNPEIYNVMAAREAAKTLQNKQNAAVSLTGDPGMDTNTKDMPDDIRGTLEMLIPEDTRMG